MAGKNKKKKSGNKVAKIVLFVIEAAILIGLLSALYILKDFGKTGVIRAEFSDGDIKMNEQVVNNEQVVEKMKGYRNIALFGVDSTAGSLEKNTRSDSIMIASINMDTGEIKLVSVYRDTILNIDGIDKYKKCNSAYMFGGAKQAMEMLNMNLDLNITDFVAVGFEGLKEAIDALGGVWVEVEKAEIVHLNNYQLTMSEDLDCDYVKVEEPGYQLLDGLQAVAYCRIRYVGSDFQRTERQREVINAIVDQAKKADPQELVDAVNSVTKSRNVYTSIKPEEILEMVPKIAEYEIVDEGGFPYEKYRGTGKMGSEGDSVLALDLEKNVQWLHEFLFGVEDYQVSDIVASYSQTIREKVAKYQPDMKYPE